jgi:hypothetical protein
MKLLLMKLSMFAALIALPVVLDAAVNGPPNIAKPGVSETSDLQLRKSPYTRQSTLQAA